MFFKLKKSIESDKDNTNRRKLRKRTSECGFVVCASFIQDLRLVFLVIFDLITSAITV